MSRRPRALTDEDRILWGRVANTVDAYPGRMEQLLENSPKTEPQTVSRPQTGAGKFSAISAAVPTKKPVRVTSLNPIDKPVYRKIAKGRVPLEARIDLHGMTQSQAHDLLLGFLIRAQGEGLRHVLVITGKGRSGDGVLRRAVPQWLSSAAFQGLASGCEQAARGHGGDGALYVRLKRGGRNP
ncbi:MAG: Smr/MutS family protein [Pseudomonadota bacterium]